MRARAMWTAAICVAMFAIAVSVGAGVGCGGQLSDDPAVAVLARGGAASGGGLPANGSLRARCSEYRMAHVPATYPAFEAEIAQWVASCVASRTGGAHREIPLVRGNVSLGAVWRLVLPGQPARITARYLWGEYGSAGRVERIDFAAPDLAVAVQDAENNGDFDRGGVPRPGPPPSPPPSIERVRVVPPPGPTPPEPTRATHDPPVDPPRDDARDLERDVRKLIDWLRARGELEDARMLERLFRLAAPRLRDIAIIVGAYYLSVKLRAGRLLFVWGWQAAGPLFQRALARLDRALPAAERAAGDMLNAVREVARRHPQLAGSGIDWDVIGEIVDPSVPAQLDDEACGPACVVMVLEDRGVHVSQADVVTQARAWYGPEIKKRKVAARAVLNLLRRLDPAGDWLGGAEVEISGASTSELARALSGTGSWIAYVGHHAVVVDGIDAAGHVLIRDPWYEFALVRGVRSGSVYRVRWETFETSWGGVAIYRYKGMQ